MPNRTKWDARYPVVPIDDRTGNMKSYPEYLTTMTEVEPFMAELTLKTFSRGRSAIQFELVDNATQKSYPMFATDFVDMCQKTVLDNGKTPLLQWTYAKRGQNYGIKLAE